MFGGFGSLNYFDVVRRRHCSESFHFQNRLQKMVKIAQAYLRGRKHGNCTSDTVIDYKVYAGDFAYGFEDEAYINLVEID
ncbi:hypothetical protein ES703_63026 [subsurface metagenome]